MRNRFNLWARTGLGLTLLGCIAALPAFAADEKAQSGDTTMPATEHQAEQMREVPDAAGGTSTGGQMPQSGDMPATKAQKEELKHSGEMSSEEGMESDSSDAMSKDDAGS